MPFNNILKLHLNLKFLKIRNLYHLLLEDITVAGNFFL